MKLVPLGDRVVLKQVAAEETTKSGIVLPGQNKEKPQQAEVVAVGPGTGEDGSEGWRLCNLLQVCRNRSETGRRRIHRSETK